MKKHFTKTNKHTFYRWLNNAFIPGIIFPILFSFIPIFSFGNGFEKSNKYSESFSNIIMPDSTVDSTSTYQFGDTIETYIEGVDTVYVLYAEPEDSTSASERLMNTKDIVVTLGDELLPVETGIIGLATTGFLLPDEANPANNVYYPDEQDPYELLSAYAPKTLRYPGGTRRRFSHAFGSMNSSNPDNPYHDQKNGGYGVNIEEVIDFYNMSDDANDPISLNDIINDMSSEPYELSWMDNDDDLHNSFIKLYNEWNQQPHYDPSSYIVDGVEQYWEEVDELYINQFIKLVEKLETENSGLRINVIVTLNIMTETAQECKAIVDYLRDETLNHEYGVNVVGVEIGNECYLNFFAKTMGFELANDKSGFDHYWAYITGADDYGEYFGTEDDFELSDVLPSYMTGNGDDDISHHAYLEEFKSDSNFDDIKIGIPAENPNVEGVAFIIGPDEDQPLDLEIPGVCGSWNTCLYARYAETINDKPAFDAVIPHQYFVSANDNNTNWADIPLCLDNDVVTSQYQNFDEVYTYATADARLACAFDAIVAGGTGTGNFREFIFSRQRDAMFALSDELHFEAGEENPKECWITEWNLKNNGPYNTEDEDDDAKDLRREVFMNTFVASYILQEQLLNYIRFNYHTSFRDGFLTYTNLQNFMDGTTTDLLTAAHKQDQLELGLIDDCEGSHFYDYVARTTYYSTRLMNQIALLNLDYLRATHTIYSLNFNRQPAVFSKELESGNTSVSVYVYFTNIKDEEQTYIIKPGTYTTTSLTGTHAEIHCIDADRLYSRSGRGALFDINDAYVHDDECDDAGYENYFEIQGELAPYIDYSDCPTNIPAGAMCVTVPSYSCGYFVFSFDPDLRLAGPTNIYSIYPNPAYNYFVIKRIDGALDEMKNMDVEIYSVTGKLLKAASVKEDEEIDISELPVGMYYIIIRADGVKAESTSLIKIK